MLRLLVAVSSLIALIAGAALVSADDWPQFLGPNRNGISEESGSIDSFPATGPDELWRVDAVGGMSGIAVFERAVYTMTQDDVHQSVLSVDASTGKTRWQTPVGNAYENSMGNGPRATPSVQGETVVVFTGDGVLAALNSSDGEIQWRVDTITDNGGKLADYGMACSPLVVDEQAIVIVGAPQATVASYDLKTGKRKWTVGKGDGAGYSSPTVLNVGGRPQVVAFTGSSVIGLDPSRGQQLWRYPFETDYQCNTATPIGIKGDVLISSGENHGSVLLSPRPDGSSAETWTALGPKAEFRCEWQTPLLLDGYLYAFDNVGSAGSVTNLTCIDASTGKPVWQQKRFGKGNAIAADGKLWITTMKGELVLVKASPRGFEELARAVIIGETRQAPALSKGRLYLRDGAEIVCLDVRKK